MYNPSCFLIHCQSNLHAGSGDTNYGIIDKMIQRDPVTKMPCIFSSSLKGALREYFEEGPEKDRTSALTAAIFGKSSDPENEGTDNSKGNTIFHEAQLIGLPVRSNLKPYFIATSKIALINWLTKSELLGLSFPALRNEIIALPDTVLKGVPKIIGTAIPNLDIEDFANVGSMTATIAELKKYLGDDIVLMNDDDFKEICSDYDLPVIARNNLENGESKNLWYEQIVPHQSRFVFYTVTIGTDTFTNSINSINGKNVQIGANSSLGYGFCKITKI